MSFASSTASSGSLMTGQAVVQYFDDFADDVFRIKDVRNYPLSLPLVAASALRVAHWYIVMDGPDGEFVLEYGDTGVAISDVEEAKGRRAINYSLCRSFFWRFFMSFATGRKDYRALLDLSHKAGYDIAAFLEHFNSRNYSVMRHNCQHFVQDFTQFFCVDFVT